MTYATGAYRRTWYDCVSQEEFVEESKIMQARFLKISCTWKTVQSIAQDGKTQDRGDY